MKWLEEYKSDLLLTWVLLQLIVLLAAILSQLDISVIIIAELVTISLVGMRTLFHHRYGLIGHELFWIFIWLPAYSYGMYHYITQVSTWWFTAIFGFLFGTYVSWNYLQAIVTGRTFF